MTTNELTTVNVLNGPSLDRIMDCFKYSILEGNSPIELTFECSYREWVDGVCARVRTDFHVLRIIDIKLNAAKGAIDVEMVIHENLDGVQSPVVELLYSTKTREGGFSRKYY